jgi:recombination protein RecT
MVEKNLTTIGKDIADAKIAPMQELIKEASKELAKSLPAHIRPERIIQVYLNCIRQNPELAQCTPESIIGGLFTSAQLGLEFVAGNAYLLPFNNRRMVGKDASGKGIWKTIKEAQFIIGYIGVINLFYRHEKSVQIEVGVVHQNDDFQYEYGTNAFLRHHPALGDRGKTIGVYCIATLVNGGKSFKYMTREECLEHGKKHSKTYSVKRDKETKEIISEGWMPNSPWVLHEEAMFLKTVIRQHGKTLPLSIELQQALSVDETSREYRKNVRSALEFKDTANWDGEQYAIEGETATEATEPAKAQAKEQTKEKQTEEPTKQSGVKHICYDCSNEGKSTEISEAEYKYSSEHFGRGLCRPHQDKQREKNEQ